MEKQKLDRVILAGRLRQNPTSPWREHMATEKATLTQALDIVEDLISQTLRDRNDRGYRILARVSARLYNTRRDLEGRPPESMRLGDRSAEHSSC
jgi:hypothetical protein